VLFAIAAPALSARASAWGPDHARVDPIVWAATPSGAIASASPALRTRERVERLERPAGAADALENDASTARPFPRTAPARARLFLLNEALLC
jgi:hypothetical protein